MLSNNYPVLRHITEFNHPSVTVSVKVGRVMVFVPARYAGDPTMWTRLKLAWGVFTGRYDAVSWEDKT